MNSPFTPYFTTALNSKQTQQQQQHRLAVKKRAYRKPAAGARGGGGGGGRGDGGKIAVERTVKYIGVCRDPVAYRSVVRAAPDSVLKAICNAALNVERGEIKLSPARKTLFRQHRQQIANLTSRRVGLASKRRILEQSGGAFWIPTLIGAAISALGSAIFGGNKEQS
jgi:hypothetical protein